MSNQPDLDTNESGAEEQDSDLIRALRAQVKDAKAAVKAAEAASEQALADARAQLGRESAAQQLVNAAGLPGLRDVVLEKVEGEVTADKVAAALEALQLPFSRDALELTGRGETVTESAPGATEVAPLVKTASLGARAAAAAQSNPVEDATKAIAEATSIEQLVAAAQAAGIHDPR